MYRRAQPAFAFLTACLWGGIAHACLCKIGSIEDEFRAARAVILVKVLEAHETWMYLPDAPGVILSRGVAVSVRVLRSWKGSFQPGSIAELRTKVDPGSGSCGYPAAKGDEIVVYFYGTEQRLFGICNASMPGRAADHVVVLDALVHDVQAAVGT